jgi:hypothetical protein
MAQSLARLWTHLISQQRFSVSHSNVGQVQRDIDGQEEHHRRRTFQDEFREFLARYQIEFDER